MNYQSGYIKEICSFYASDCHLATMMLPYLAKQVKIQTNIETILDKDILQYISKLLEKINVEENLKEQILKINWNNLDINQIDIEKYIIKNLKIKSQNILIIKTSKNNFINNQINQFIKRKSDYIIKNNIKLNIIYCYNIQNLENMDDIINKYEYVLNTSGIHQVKDVFKHNIKDDAQIINNKFVV